VDIRLFPVSINAAYRRLVSHVREADIYERNNRITLILCSIGPAVFGSGISIIVWVIACWNLICMTIGRLKHVLVPPERRFCWMMASYPAAMAVTSALSLNAFTTSMFAKLLPAALFLAPALLLKRYGVGDARIYRQVMAESAAAGAAISAAIAAYAQLFGEFQPEGLAGNPYPFAVSAMIAGTISCMAGGHGGKPALLGFAAFLFACLTAMLSEVRAVMLFIPVAVLLICWQYGPLLREMLTRRAVFALLAVTALAIVPFAPSLMHRIGLVPSEITGFTQGNDTATSIGKRFAMWKGGAPLILEAPLFGHGIQNRGEMLERARLNAGSAPFGVTHFHNFIVNALVDGGLLLAIATLVTLFAPLIYAYDAGRAHPDRGRAFMAAALTAVYAIGGMTGPAFGQDILDALFVFTASAIVFTTRAAPQDDDAARDTSQFQLEADTAK
jgi:O-antigen ligase